MGTLLIRTLYVGKQYNIKYLVLVLIQVLKYQKYLKYFFKKVLVLVLKYIFCEVLVLVLKYFANGTCPYTANWYMLT